MLSETADVCKTLMEARDSLSACLCDSNKTHYVACIPSMSNTIKVYSDLRDVLKLMKEHKNQNPRMLSFPTLADAEAFASRHTASEVCQGANIKSSYPQEKAEVELAELKLFPSLTTPQLNEFRIFLEKGNINAAFERILANPRFLVLSIDMPTILKEGTRYNALHASVIAGQLESCRLVMEMISDVEYLKRLYETQQRAEENSKRLIDLYLNTPDKGANKTPLHFASERGFVDIVAFLVSFKACIRNFNRHIHETGRKGGEHYDRTLVTGETPEETACSRYKGPNAASIKAKIVDLIRGGTCYVPLIRSDTTGPYAQVGDPYTPTSPYKLVSEIEDVLKPTSVASLDLDTKDFRNMKVWAFAGPMSPRQAEEFRKEWKSPRLVRHSHSGIHENHKVVDGDRGFERFGRELADCHATSWQEYWPFLDAFADLRSEEGLDKLELFFQKQHVINLMQALLRKEDFTFAQPYQVDKEYILVQDFSESEESEEENEVYFSAESPSCSEEDGLDGSEVCATPAGKKPDASPASPSKPSGGVFSSLWGSIIKLKNILSPSLGKHRHNSTVDNVPHTESCKLTANNRIDSLKSEACLDAGSLMSEVSTTKLSCDFEDTTSPSGCTTRTSQLNHLHNNAEMDTTESCATAPPQPCTQQDDVIKSDQVVEDSSPLPSSKVPEYASLQVECSDSELSDPSRVTEHTKNVVDPQHSPSGTECPLKRKADLDIFQTPDKRKYRTQVQSPESDSSSPDKDLTGCFSPSSVDAASPVVGMRDSCPASLSESPFTNGARLDDSFNSKMDSFSQSLQKFSILSPSTSPSVSTTTTPSSPSSKPDSDMEPSLHIFTGKLFSKFLSELKSQKFTDVSNVSFDDQALLPTLFLRQSGNSLILADVFLPGSQRSGNSLSRAHSQILDELTHKEAVKNVWTNFLVIFTTPNEAKRISSLSKDDVVCAVVEGMAEEKDIYCSSSYSKLDHCSLSDLFIKSKDSLYDTKHSSTLIVRIVRSSTLPSKDVFVCGSIPSKMDADVYHTLNSRACQLIRKQPSRLPHLLRWYDQMSKQGKDYINSLPSPSRILRPERRRPPPMSPLVSTPLRSGMQHQVGESKSLPAFGVAQSGSSVRNLFGGGKTSAGK